MDDLKLISGVGFIVAAALLVAVMFIDRAGPKLALRRFCFGTASALFLCAGVLSLATA